MSKTLQPTPADHQQSVVDRFFKGSHSLHNAFRLSCISQFPCDMKVIGVAIESGDADAIRRHAHNLKSALAMLGLETLENQALKLELAAYDGDMSAAALAWHGLEADLHHFIDLNQVTKKPT